MASIIDLYKGSEFENAPKKSNDKTPISDDGGVNMIANKTELDRVRGGAVQNTKKYSDTVNLGN
jgi:hypothetical protein